jgi:protein-tyrosine phosphatase
VKKILFVCTGNICRSPAAEAIFNALARDRGMESRATSAGVHSLQGRGIAEETAMALEEIGIPYEGHRARQLNRSMVREADLVLVMSEGHAEEVRTLLGELPGHVHVLPVYATGVPGSSIADPYGYTISAHRAAVRHILECVERLIDHLGK